jgi:hypothetical protein
MRWMDGVGTCMNIYECVVERNRSLRTSCRSDGMNQHGVYFNNSLPGPSAQSQEPSLQP